MSVWFVQRGDEQLGPLKPAELLALVRDGSVVAETKIRKDDSNWFTASEVGGLFEAARRPTIEHYCPNCNVRVNQPPTHCPECGKDLERTKTRIIENSIAQTKRPSDSQSSGPSNSAKRWLQKKIRRDKK
ncbi:GYF domain-containing protein [Rhodopirellula halodulae]|uniref:GYF domain-containing protein n=1 Tax=Rhodopirellula halodulae TaxID=2894198 RepID=UPI001E461F93|nr:GYF domain-containing protein [Rhodopirellula sp. JC737]MCC9657314.1 GYF domain-containing protein [Rhodopirellula sp. JC737]